MGGPCEAVFGVEGSLQRVIQGFESRPYQQEMAEEILDAFSSGEIALLEAGTGTGKSMAYLFPAIEMALSQAKRTVISTHTINLQQQLLEKDIPLLLSALQTDVKVVLVKGMSNYLCLRRLQEAQGELSAMHEAEAEQFKALEAWSAELKDSSEARPPFSVSPALWDRVCVEGDTCLGKLCSMYDACPFIKSRSEVEDAQILIVNHYLLLADLQLKEEAIDEGAGILPAYDYLIVDEAHHLEEVATDSFARRISRRAMMRLVGHLLKEPHRGSTKGQGLGKLFLLRQKLGALLDAPDLASDVQSLAQRLDVALPLEVRQLTALINETFEAIAEFVDPDVKGRLRLRTEQLELPQWQGELVPRMEALASAMRALVQSIDAMDEALQGLQDAIVLEKTRGIRKDLQAIGNRLEAAAATLEAIGRSELDPGEVRWLEVHAGRALQVEMVSACLDVSRLLAEKLYSSLESVIFVSATLTTQKDFSYARQRLGLTQELLGAVTVREARYASPFSYETQAMFVVPTDLPSPQHPGYLDACTTCMWELIDAAQGNTFLLFTSYQMLSSCYERLQERCELAGYPLLKQGERDRGALLELFKKTDGSVLFGTDSFWEGVDVVGDALRCVVLVKLPFCVPTEPIVQARLERMEEAGENPFMRYTVPSAIVKFKQGFGRLVRNKSDRGCVACLDSRLVHKPYGRLFLESLPPCRKVIDRRSAILQDVKEFFGV